MKKTRKIYEEKKQIALIVDSVVQSDLSCAFCGTSSKMISPLLAAKLSNVSTREIYLLIESGKIHFTELPGFEIFVCLNSLNQSRLNVPLLPPSFISS